jgi:hypothetical protein
VERPADLEGHHPADAELGGGLRGPLHARRRAGDDDLAGGVVVGQPALVGSGLAGLEGLLLLDAEDGGHPARVAVGGSLGGLGPAGGQANAVVERQGAGGDQSGDLAERMAGEGHGRR